MKLAATADVSLSAILDAEARHIAQAAARAVDTAATALRAELADETRTALGNGLARAWSVRRYGNASLVYSKATRIVEAFSADTIITARNAQWLVLPLEAAIERGFNKAQARKWANLEAATQALGPLTFVPLPGNRALLVRRNRGGKPTPFFLLTKRVSLRKRLDIAGPAAHAVSQLRDAFLADAGAA